MNCLDCGHKMTYLRPGINSRKRGAWHCYQCGKTYRQLTIDDFLHPMDKARKRLERRRRGQE
ncbi:hypothetical protein GCM10023228_16590 [Brevibacillus fulvus]|uniref:Transposase-like protein n=1 Tax=Brevibacillus fulvus TaxID=1125967 RepID=A0A938XW35_9BACL|nr:transposase-like protein [Brevibacillus fulvus]